MSLTRLSTAALLPTLLASSLVLRAQPQRAEPAVGVPLQPLAQQARRLETALAFLGQPLTAADHQAINEATALADEQAAVAAIQRVLDPYVLAHVRINPESRVSVVAGPARPDLVQGGTRLFLLKVANEAGVTAPLAVESPNHGRVYIPSSGSPAAKKVLNDADVRERWADISVYTQPPMRPRLSGLELEYVDPAGLQPRRREALGRPHHQRRAGQPGRRLPQRSRGPLHGRASASDPPERQGRARPAGHRRLPDPRRGGPDLSRALETPGTGLLLPAPGLPRRRPDDRPAARTVHHDHHPRAGIPADDAAVQRGRPHGAAVPPRPLDRPHRRRLVSGRPSHPLRRLLALREPDRGRAAGGDLAADRRRSAERGLGADLGAVVLLPEAVLQRRRIIRCPRRRA